MKNIKILIIALLFAFTSCTTIPPGHKGVKVKWGGKTDMEQIYNEGMKVGLNWVWDDMVKYDCREQQMVLKGDFLDYDGLDTEIEVIVYYSPDPNSVNQLHTQVSNWEERLTGIFKGAVKQVIPKHQALKLNREERDVAEASLAKILEPNLKSIYIDFKRVEITDVSLPDKISKMIVLAKEQDERNNLAEKKESEQKFLAQAQVARAKGEYEAAIFDAKTKEILSQPKMLELQRVENEKIMWEGYKEHGKSPYGNNNVFGSETAIIKGLK
jgi:regulator of protease activity HflC (stomatin/prohibitin superfamily)